MNAISEALRCMSDPTVECPYGDTCPYYMVEEIDEKLKALADYTLDGKYYCFSCDEERILKDAADLIDELTEEDDRK